jgi:hypothetical protein
VPGTMIDRDYPGSRPRGGGSLHPATTHYSGTMCTVTMVVLVAMRSAMSSILMAKSCLKGSSTPAYKGAWRGHHGSSGAGTT